MYRAVVALSGGMDSATVLAQALRDCDHVTCFGFEYGSKHGTYERVAAKELAAHYGVPYQIINLPLDNWGFKSDLLVSGGAIPEGHYEDKTMRRTVVPCRNLIFASILAGLAESHGADRLYLGIHAGDHAIYPDCRPAFYIDLREAILEATEHKVLALAPFLDHTKEDILRIGTALGVPYNLTRTCYKDQGLACGKCGSCQERLAAFAALQIDDPLEYESRDIMPRAVEPAEAPRPVNTGTPPLTVSGD